MATRRAAGEAALILTMLLGMMHEPTASPTVAVERAARGLTEETVF
jgi:hypothetical protein